LALNYWQVLSGNNLKTTATIGLWHKNGEKNDEELIKAAYGDGPVAAAYKAIDKIVGVEGHLLNYSLQAIDHGEDSQRNKYGHHRGQCEGLPAGCQQSSG